MNGIRVYVKAAYTEIISSNDVFYSRRGGGPLYRWRYEEVPGHWRAARMHSADFNYHELCTASWKSVPGKLQAQLGEHYLE